MTPQHILRLNAVSTAACAIGMLATRPFLYSLFGLDTPILLDVLAVGLWGYALALTIAAHRQPVSRLALMIFTAGDALWVVGSVFVLVLFWTQLTPLARVLVIAVAAVVEVFTTLQFRAVGRSVGGSPQVA